MGSGSLASMAPPHPAPEPPGLAAALPDGVAVLGPDGAVEWANEALARLLDQPLDELIGSNGFELVHPDELARAFDGIAYAAEFPDRTAVVPYRVRRGDGTWLDTELKSAVVAGHDGVDRVVLVVRDGTTRRSLGRALESVAGGETVQETGRWVAGAIAARWPETGAAVSARDLDGRRTVTAVALPDALVAHAAGEGAGLGDGDDGPLWRRIGPPGEVHVFDTDRLPAAVAGAARAAGFEGCAAVAITDPGGEPACLVVWFDHLSIASLEFVHDAGELCELVALALERRHHLWQLWHGARHDALTGLTNRAGFFEQLDASVAAARQAGDVVGVLYIDLDSFKAINDAAGHAAGDLALVQAADDLRSLVRDGDVVARLGGDEFAVICRVDPDVARERLEHVADCIVARTAASVGFALDDGSSPPVRLVEWADAAMYDAKAAGRRRWRAWAAEGGATVAQR